MLPNWPQMVLKQLWYLAARSSGKLVWSYRHFDTFTLTCSSGLYSVEAVRGSDAVAVVTLSLLAAGRGFRIPPLPPYETCRPKEA